MRKLAGWWTSSRKPPGPDSNRTAMPGPAVQHREAPTDNLPANSGTGRVPSVSEETTGVNNVLTKPCHNQDIAASGKRGGHLA